MSSEPEKRSAGRSRWTRWALAGSLMLNMAFVGLAAGAVLKFRSDGGAPRNVDMTLGPLGRALGSDERRELAGSVRRMEGTRPSRRDTQARLVRETIVILRQSPFEPDALSAFLDEQRNAWGALQANAQAALVHHIAAMSDEERNAFADRVQEQVRARPSGDRDNGSSN